MLDCIYYFNNRKHATRVLNLLEIYDQFDGILYCDYSIPNFHCKPEPSVFEMVMKLHGVSNPTQCYFIDDSVKNIKYASEIGWNCALLSEADSTTSPFKKVKSASEFLNLFPELKKCTKSHISNKVNP